VGSKSDDEPGGWDVNDGDTICWIPEEYECDNDEEGIEMIEPRAHPQSQRKPNTAPKSTQPKSKPNPFPSHPPPRHQPQSLFSSLPSASAATRSPPSSRYSAYNPDSRCKPVLALQPSGHPPCKGRVGISEVLKSTQAKSSE